MLMHAIAVTKINITRTSTSTPPTMPMIMSISFVSGEVEGCSALVAGVLVVNGGDGVRGLDKDRGGQWKWVW